MNLSSTNPHRRPGGFCQRSWEGMTALTLLTCMTALSGCGDDGPKTYPVKGKIAYKGSARPVTSGLILFESLSEPKVQASGDIQSDGTFELASDLGKPGTVAGEHRIMIEPPFPEYGEKAAVSNRYASFTTSGLKATIKEGENSVDLEIDPN